jgi:LacI family transcriptional regulator
MRNINTKMRSLPVRKVAILYPASVPWIARCIDSLRRYARERGGWHLFSSPTTLTGAEKSALTIRSMRGWKGDAIIVATNNENDLRFARKMAIPMVNLAGGLPKSYGIPRVMVNHLEAGSLAADHLLSRGLRNLAFFGWEDYWYSEQRRLGFMERAEKARIKCELFLQVSSKESSLTWPKRIASLAKWLKSLPRPVGVFSVNDYRAQLLIEACQEAKLRVPDDISVIGMDDDETVCEHCVPTLTSISRSSEQVGWEAAVLLDGMMQGNPPPEADSLLTSDGVIARQSTDMLYCGDAVAQRALDYMRSRLQTQFNIEEVAAHIGVSKRTLEMRFRASLQRSPHEFLRRLRIERAQALLLMPQKRTNEQTAIESGFGTIGAFYAAFRQITGEWPGSFRKKHLEKSARS